MVGPIPRRCLCAAAVHCRQTDPLVTRQDELRVPHHHGRRTAVADMVLITSVCVAYGEQESRAYIQRHCTIWQCKLLQYWVVQPLGCRLHNPCLTSWTGFLRADVVTHLKTISRLSNQAKKSPSVLTGRAPVDVCRETRWCCGLYLHKALCLLSGESPG